MTPCRGTIARRRLSRHYRTTRGGRNVEVHLDVTTISLSDAVDGMRRPFVREFGRTWVGRRLGRAAWTGFHAALIHGAGVDVATSYALVAAEESNSRTMLVARWSTQRIRRAVHL